MKKTLAAAILAALFLLSGCNHPTEEDFIPEKMGAADDGLWLYRSDLTRTRSDGSGQEPLPLITVMGGKQAELGYWLAETDTHTLFYVLTQGGDEQMSSLRAYNYETKLDEELIPAFSGKFASPAGLPVRAGGGRVFVHAQKTREADEYYLFDMEGNPLFQTQISYEFDERSGLLRTIKTEQDLEGMKNRTTFRYYFEQEREVVLTTDSYFWREYTAGGWSYLLFMDGSVVAINLTTGEQKEGTLPPWDELHQYDKDYIFTAGGAVFVFAYREFVPPYGLDGAELYALKGGEVNFLRAFGETSVTAYGPLSGRLALDLTTKDLYQSRLYVDDSLEFFREEPATESEPEKFFCGEYAFWVEQKSWSEGFMGRRHFCYYLWRQRGEEEPEVMQYKFTDDNTAVPFFFDILPM